MRHSVPGETTHGQRDGLSGSTRQPVSPDPVLEIRNLFVQYDTPAGPVEAVRDVSLTVARGETLGIVGESGCGKSSLAFAIMGYPGPAARVRGQIHLAGQDLLAMSAGELRALRGSRLSMVYQDPLSTLNPSTIVGEQIAEVYRTHRGASPEVAWTRAVDMLARVGIGDHESVGRRYPHQLSGGMQQRVVIAMAVCCDPEVLILDEPTTALDVTTEARVLDLVSALQREFDSAVLYISHNLGVIAQVCDRVAVMYAGEVVEEGSVRAVFRQPQHPYTVGLLGCVPRLGADKTDAPLRPIPGSLPPQIQRGEGCVFASRCGLSRGRCLRVEPEVREAIPGHWTRCHFPREVARWSPPTASRADLSPLPAVPEPGPSRGGGWQLPGEWPGPADGGRFPPLPPAPVPEPGPHPGGKGEDVSPSPLVGPTQERRVGGEGQGSALIPRPPFLSSPPILGEGEARHPLSQDRERGQGVRAVPLGEDSPAARDQAQERRPEAEVTGPSAHDAPLLSVRGLTKHYEEEGGLGKLLGRLFGQRARPIRAVDGVSVQVAAGQTLALVGESGCGKTTLGRCIAGLVEISGGQISFAGEDASRPVEKRRPDLRRQIQMVFQNPEASLNPRHTVGYALERSVLRLVALEGMAAKRRVGELLRAVNLDPGYATRYPGQLSGGEKQRVAIARALAGQPRLVVLDEPISALDVSVQASVLNLLVQLQRQLGTAYVFISHDLSVVRYVADWIAVIYLGQLCELGRTADLFRPPHHPYTEALLSAVPVPDPDAARQRIRLEGTVPTPRNPPCGCVFHTRCPKKRGVICESTPPPARLLADGHQIRCHLETATE